MTKKQEILNQIRNFNGQGVGVSRQTLSGATQYPINTVCSSVDALKASGAVYEKGEAVGRKLLWAA